MDVADCDGQPVALTFLCKPLCLVQAGKAHLRSKNLFIRRHDLVFVPHDRAELRFTGNLRGMRKISRFPRCGNVFLQRQTRTVNHDGLVACADGALDQ